MKNLMIVGAAGKQGFEYFNLLKTQYKIVALVDSDKAALAKRYSEVLIPRFETVKEAVAHTDVDVAILAVPHAYHFSLSSFLLKEHIHVIKEKPFALNQHEAASLLSQAREVHKSIFVITQRHSTNAFEFLKENIDRIGRPLYFNYEFFMKLPTQTSGWRARREISAGGVVLDMGYHAVDVLTRLFGEPTNIQTNLSFRYDDMFEEGLEDSSLSVFKYKRSGLFGNLVLDRHSDKKHESLKIFGTKGSVEWGLHSLVVETASDGKLLSFVEEKNSAYVMRQLVNYIERVDDKVYFETQAAIYVTNTKVIETMYLNGESIFLPKAYNQPVTNLYAIRS
jgi:predicted dehydrogenase